MADKNVRYYIDGRLLAPHGGKFYPESFMSLNFSLWFIRDCLVKSKEPRAYRQDIDWVFHEAKKVLTPEEVEARIAALFAVIPASAANAFTANSSTSTR